MKTAIEVLSEIYETDDLQTALILNPDVNRICEAMEQFANQSRWVFDKPESDGTYLIAFDYGVTEGKYWRGEYLTKDFDNKLPGAYAWMPIPDKPQPTTE
jgi:hypothetical protein